MDEEQQQVNVHIAHLCRVDVQGHGSAHSYVQRPLLALQYTPRRSFTVVHASAETPGRAGSKGDGYRPLFGILKTLPDPLPAEGAGTSPQCDDATYAGSDPATAAAEASERVPPCFSFLCLPCLCFPCVCSARCLNSARPAALLNSWL